MVGVACLAPVKRGNNLPLLTGKQYLREYGFTPVMGCAQIDHTPYGLVRSGLVLALEAPREYGRWALLLEGTCGGVACLAPVKREITFPS